MGLKKRSCIAPIPKPKNIVPCLALVLSDGKIRDVFWSLFECSILVWMCVCVYVWVISLMWKVFFQVLFVCVCCVLYIIFCLCCDKIIFLLWRKKDPGNSKKSALYLTQQNDFDYDYFIVVCSR